MADEKYKKKIAEMIGDFFREVAALVAVFAILDKLIAGDPGWHWVVWTLWVAGAIFVSALFLTVGIAIERKRP